MPKSKIRKKSTKGNTKSLDWGAGSAKGSGLINLVLAAVALAAVVAGGLYFWQLRQASSGFDALIAAGQPAPPARRSGCPFCSPPWCVLSSCGDSPPPAPPPPAPARRPRRAPRGVFVF